MGCLDTVLSDLEDDYVATFGRGRICAHEGCGTILSTYNPSTYCSLHEPPGDEAPEGAKVCSICQRTLPIEQFALKRKVVNNKRLVEKNGVKTWRLSFCRSCGKERKRQASDYLAAQEAVS